MQKVWSVKKYDKEKINELVMKYNISEMLAKLILAREIEDVDMFLNGTLEDLKDPYKMKDMEKFVERINKAKENNEKICIYGDYDVDGITSITVMYKFLKKLGLNVIYYLPDRLMEGYGVNTGALDKIKNGEDRTRDNFITSSSKSKAKFLFFSSSFDIEHNF